MKKLPFVFLLAVVCSVHTYAQTRAQVLAYIDKFKAIAMAEMARTGVPAAITLAQGIHETGAGTSDLVLQSNNHFGIKCKGEWNGDKVYHDDDAKGECFRKYEDPALSYKDHSDFLRNRPYYASLFNLDPTDYEAWAYGLKKAGYATNPRYPQILIGLIRDYNLQDYTLIVLGKKTIDPNAPEWANYKEANANKEQALGVAAVVKTNYPEGIFTINDTKVIFIPKGTSYLKVAEEQHTSLSRLLDFNDMKDGDVAQKDGLLYLQRKRKTGAHETHTVATGESLHDIAQAEGIRLESLLQYNFLTDNAPVAAGEKLYLNGKAPSTPKLVPEKTPMITASVEQNEQPVKEVATVNAVKDDAGTRENNFVVHVVQPKETVYSIAKKYEVAVDDVKKWNNMETSDLKIGQQLKINKTR